MGGDPSPGLVTEATLWPSDSASVLAASSRELDSGLVLAQRPRLFWPLGVAWPAIQGTVPVFSRDCPEDGLAVLFCSEECEDRDSRLPMGVL